MNSSKPNSPATGQTTTFLYDADGNRIKRQTPTSTTVYIGADYETNTVAGAKLSYSLAGIRVGFRNTAGVNWTFADPLPGF